MCKLNFVLTASTTTLCPQGHQSSLFFLYSRLRSRALLAALGDSLRQLQVFNTLGFECTLEEVDLEDITASQVNTLKACMSEGSGAGNCPVLERDTFDTNKCLRGIYEDLKAYRAELKDFSDQKVLTTIDEMMKALQVGSPNAPQPSSNTALTFKERMRLCSVLHAFRIRTVTINRMLNHLTSLESSL
ncbi:PREDICTED: interleukin-12 subunit alpha [Tinamus guttatus]|uniref:interleukin-12 subunit alpha n=1 Tax=Tinamus guttatus TaxID=94827 RepID=UPI00052F369B|nr:PREDICTED: interleukin-12 subunit alpha [Tinamus guttatus]